MPKRFSAPCESARRSGLGRHDDVEGLAGGDPALQDRDDREAREIFI